MGKITLHDELRDIFLEQGKGRRLNLILGRAGFGQIPVRPSCRSEEQ